MPKRRLPSTGHQRDNDSSLRQHRIFSRSSSRKRISEVFTKLADAFNKHAEYHMTTKSFVRPDEDEAKLPERCRKDLASVRALLPKLEKCFPPQQAVNCDASDLAHLCNFYERVLRGVYCPHSPGLFQWGRVPKDGKCYCNRTALAFPDCRNGRTLQLTCVVTVNSLYSLSSDSLAIASLHLPFGGHECELVTKQGSATSSHFNCQYDSPAAQLLG